MHEITHPYKNLIERLENCGTIILRDKEALSYTITVNPTSIKFVTDILNRYCGINNYKMNYKPESVQWDIEFKLSDKKEEVTQ